MSAGPGAQDVGWARARVCGARPLVARPRVARTTGAAPRSRTFRPEFTPRECQGPCAARFTSMPIAPSCNELKPVKVQMYMYE